MAKKIIIIEDDTLLIRMYKTKFENSGYQVLTAGDGVEALEIIKKEIPDFIISDVMMPKLSGIQVIEEIRKDPQLAHIPVLMLSNLSDPTQMEKAKQLGVKEFILKANFTPSQIVDKVEQYSNE